jgi:dTDP-4-amino-4,6-dideoxygalactose transaminase
VTDGPIRLARPDVGEAELAAVAEVLESGQLTMGPRVAAFERAVAEAVGTSDAVAVSTGTAALHLAMLAVGIGPGDDVIVPAYTFPATANAVELAGGRAVLVDVDPETFLARPELVADAVTPRTRAVIAVHLFGRPVAWEELQTAVPQEVALVEDAAGALGARYRDTPCGALGLMGCLSFHPRKIVTTGEGGAVTTDEAELASAVRRLRHHGIGAGDRVDIAAPGFNYRLPDVLCALGIPQLARLDSLLRARERVAGWYTERLAHLVGTPGADEGDRHGWQAYVVTLDRRDEALAGLRAQGIEAQIGTYAVNRLSAYRDRGSFPGADAAFERALALPFASTTTEDEVDRVTAALHPCVEPASPGASCFPLRRSSGARGRRARRRASSPRSGTRAPSAGTPACRTPTGRGPRGAARRRPAAAP